jgi:TonB family protein
VVAKTGAKPVLDSMRFFMVPGMGHGPGTTGEENFNYDALATIEQWKITGKAPDELIFDHYKNGMQAGKRLVCRYPDLAVYKGVGNTEDSANFTCAQRIGGGVTPPAILSRVEPQYPDLARQAGMMGTVVLQALIDEDGKVIVLSVVRALGYGLDESAIEAIGQWRFRPAMNGGVPVKVALNIEVNFNQGPPPPRAPATRGVK